MLFHSRCSRIPYPLFFACFPSGGKQRDWALLCCPWLRGWGHWEVIRGALGDLLCEPSPTCRIVQAEGQRALPHVPYGIGQEDPRPGDTCESWGMLSWKLKVSHSVVSMDCSPPGSSVHGILPKIAGVGSHSLLPGVFPTEGLNPGLLHCRRILYHLSHQGDTTKSCRRYSRLTSLWSGKKAGI